ncbi:CatB-related O-acetyltransferase [Psychroflexus salis]|uniref:Acetyltransferase (Isoleucine patch superfamily) n=1 Tax=Psychroflexus salis TaxID=1526574 RepID=A0A916ZRR2_9FLAO|nr:antibiotic acetyltransferase [Psychroflexus salis]GGE10713.1 hypothetical protein GCM10010831_10230 [Psychroflexus salis]
MINKLKNSLVNRLITYIEQKNTISKSAHIGKHTKVIGSKIGAGVIIGDYSNIYDSNLLGSISLGDKNLVKNVSFSGVILTGENCRLSKCDIIGNVKLGRFSSLWGPNLNIRVKKNKLEIGSFCSIARNVSFQSYNHNFKKITSYYIGQNLFKESWDDEIISKGDINIQNDVWIGSDCIILGGVEIGNGAIIASNSVVTKNVEPYSIVGGTPSKIIGYRFDEKTRNYLLNLKWWEWSVEEIVSNKKLFQEEFKLNKV